MAADSAGHADLIGPGIELAGRYQVTSPIGRGGMAVVFRGHDLLLDRDVAIKVLGSAAANATGSQQEFLREARAAAALSHPNIVSVYDAGVHGSERYIVMEYVANGSLHEIIQSEAPLLPNRVVALATQVADALDYGHRRDVIHCDVKPQNVLIDENGRPKLVDFGISRSIASTGALTDTVTGTAGYIAPEQLLGERLDGRADIYALGCVVYEMLSGELPFDASSLAALAAQRLVRPPIPLESRRPNLPPRLVHAVMRALAREPDDRYPTAHDFAQALSQPTGAIGEQMTERLPRHLSRPDPETPTLIVERPAKQRLVARHRNLFWPLSFAFLILVGVVGALATLAYPPLFGDSSGSLVQVPAVEGQTVAAASEAIHAQGLTVSLQPQDGATCTGKVLRQDPNSPAELRRGHAVTLVVSTNPQC